MFYTPLPPKYKKQDLFYITRRKSSETFYHWILKNRILMSLRFTWCQSLNKTK